MLALGAGVRVTECGTQIPSLGRRHRLTPIRIVFALNRLLFHELRRRARVLAALAALQCLTGCLREPLESRRSTADNANGVEPSRVATAATGRPTSEQGILLEGTFEQVAKKVSGGVSLERSGETYELVVHDVALNDVGPVHVYFVGLPEVRSSMDLDGVDAKYDFGPLEEVGSGNYVAVQRIKLPSKPKPELRSVALINPRFGVVLASSSLKEPR